jgi:membrane-associated phospholipid phosphatase
MNLHSSLPRFVFQSVLGLNIFFVCSSATAQTTPQNMDQQDSFSAIALNVSQVASTMIANDDAPSIERAALADLGVADSPGVADGASDTAPSSAGAPVDTTQYKPVRCDISSLGRCIKDLLGDQAGIWTSPLRIRKRDLLWLLPLGAATGAALATDSRASAALGFTATNRIRYSKDFSDAMEDTAWATAGGLYIIGKITHNEHARETGVLSVEAAIDATIVAEVLKLATDRLRPNVPPNTGPFWQDSTYTTNGSFPSGHSVAVWSVAKVISDETPGNVWLHIGLYLAATATAVTRVTAQEHFPSDVLVGSAIGYLVGGYVYRHHSAADGREGSPIQILPFTDAATRSAGLAVSLDAAALHLKSPQQLWTSLKSDLPFHAGDN